MQAPRVCPTCGRVPEPEPASLKTTGEFAIGNLAQFADAGSAVVMTPAVPTAPAASPTTCSWCGKAAADVRKLLSSHGVQICDGCVSLCYMILKDELPGFE